MSILSTIFDIVFPAKCLSCGESGSDLCLECLSDSPEAERESASWIFPLYDYRHPPIKKSIKLLKYKGRRGLAKVFAESLYGRILEELSELRVMENFRDALLMPIPLSKKRQRERGFNQAELICKKLLELDKGENFELRTDILIKPKDTPHQADIADRSKRLKNIIGSFAANKEEIIKNRNIILIDDVTTTGATLTEAKRTLKKASARKIIAFTVAH